MFPSKPVQHFPAPAFRYSTGIREFTDSPIKIDLLDKCGKGRIDDPSGALPRATRLTQADC